MSDLVSYSCLGTISRIVMDDGKVNAMSTAMLNALHKAFDDAERDKTVVILTGRGKCFSAGFDLNVFATGTAAEIHTMLKAGAELALRILSFPAPVVTACNGHAYPEGAFLIMSSDFRIAADGPFKIGMNEVAIGLTPPRFAIEVARQRLTPAYFNRAVLTGEMFAPAEAVIAGFFDRVVPPAQLDDAALQIADFLTAIDREAHKATKAMARGAAIKAIRTAIDQDITLAEVEKAIARRG